MGGHILNRTQRIFFVKVIALLSIVRWYNILVTALAQYLTALYVFNPGVPVMELLGEPDLHLMVLTTTLIIAAGYIINSFYDLEKDLINRPEQTIFGRLISKSFCLRCYLFFNTVALFTAIFISANVLIYFVLFAAALWVYSHKLQRIPVIRELSASLLSVASVLVIALYYQHISRDLLLYAFMMMLILFNKEIIKDFINMKGDAIYNVQTIPLQFGKRTAFMLVAAFSVLAIICAGYFLFNTEHIVLQVSMFIAMLMLIWVVVLLKTPDKTGVKMGNTLYKLLIVLCLAMSLYL